MMFLKLFHGRTDPAAQMDDRGTDGPVFGPLEFCHTTYNSRMCLRFVNHEDVDIKTTELEAEGPDNVEDMLYYDGVYYGEWSVFDESLLTPELQARVVKYDARKSVPPAAVAAPEVDDRKKDLWSENPKFSRAEWRDAVGDNDTQLGYWDWVDSQLEQELNETSDGV